MNFLLWTVGILLLILTARLFYLQVLNGDSYKAEVNRSDTTTETNSVQRGMIYDSTGKVLVGNQAHQAVTYTKDSSATTADIYKTAKILGKYLTVSTAKLTKREQKDYFLADSSNLKKMIKKIPGASKLSDSDQYTKVIDYLGKHPSEYKLSDAQKNKAMIYASMSGAYSLSTTYIKETGVTSKEIAEVGEHLNEMTGVKVGTSWSRNYPSGSAIQSLTGSVSNQKTGLPSDEVNMLLSEGYSRNDSVGQSYLEKEYQSTLAGSKSQTEVSSSSSKQITKAVTKYAGKKGDNLVLTINAKFQKQVQKIVKSDYSSFGGNGNSTGAYAVVMNPNTGAIYAMGGVDRDLKTGKITSDQIGSINHPIVMGSVVKGATVLGALMDGVITPSSNTLNDQPIKVAGTASKSSWWNRTGSVPITAEEALEVSSNSYMMQLAMKEAGTKYVAGSSLNMPTSIFSKLRGYFNQFGLGVKTGIDLPGETTGYTGPTNVIGKALDLAYGNYDSYTVMQLAQYASTIANGGYRMKPYVVQQVRGTNKDGSLGKVESTTQPTILNTINATQAQWKVVRSGMNMVVHGSSAYKTGSAFSSLSPSVSAKTGTAETFRGTTSTLTHSVIMFGPSSDPQVVIAIAVPGASTSSAAVSSTMGKEIYEAYWKTVQSSSGY
ncbi:penicillin-binding protein, transpeptidase [Paucilactobacillus hokkaidonensis]|uniref:Penicillin-binding protein, transpeptidase n=1 Tax=Paucilactobacillus hokkaidonensis TaxID=1193095 RepID=A0ABR5Q2Z4_9LACO|nr:penicillin-binding protein, transpeptidase [Paucilactobacillus hokkaidonensis]